MPTVGYNTQVQRETTTVFKVRNIAPGNKRIKVFSYPIKNGDIRDLLKIPFVSEADIRHSLLKGELYTKIISHEIEIYDSNIDLLQFDDEQKLFLQTAGIIKGLEATGGSGSIPFVFKQSVELDGAKDGSNRIFTVPIPDKFVNGTLGANEFKILIIHNGRRLVQGIDYVISESGGTGTGFDTITLISFAPESDSELFSDYVVKA